MNYSKTEEDSKVPNIEHKDSVELLLEGRGKGNAL